MTDQPYDRRFLELLGFRTPEELSARIAQIQERLERPEFKGAIDQAKAVFERLEGVTLPAVDEHAREALERARAVSSELAARAASVLDAFGHQIVPASGVYLGHLHSALERHQTLLKQVPGLPPESRRPVGQRVNEAKDAIATTIREVEGLLIKAGKPEEEGPFDPTLPAPRPRRGSLHPVTLVVRRLEAIFTSMGYAILDGPEVELDAYNFEKLNIPADHPAREMHDTFWCDRDQKLLMRTHTSPVQIRALERMPPPFRAIVPGRCFRNETTDASHEHTFHQMEGLVVGEGITVGHLIGTMRTFLREVFERDLEVRLRPGYFPFVEPGFELDVRCPFCEAGCSVCKRSTWIELCPCGMVHPRVLAAGKVDPERYTGFAFGLGLSRLVMLRYGIDDIRHLMGADLRFLEQF